MFHEFVVTRDMLQKFTVDMYNCEADHQAAEVGDRDVDLGKL